MINFSCSCGKKLQTQDAHAGRRVQCPDCGATLIVPGAAETHGQSDPIPVRRVTHAPRSSRDADEAAPANRTGLILGLVIGGVVVLGGLITVLVLVLGGGKRTLMPDPQARAHSQNNLKQIGIAMINYNDSMRRLPPAVVYDQTGKPLYSWRVLLLPYIEEDGLYKEFHFHEAWDSPHNHSLLSRMPRPYAHPNSSSTTDTHYQVFNGPGAAFNSPLSSVPEKLLRPFHGVPNLPPGVQVFELEFSSTRFPFGFTDGTSNTIMVAEAAEAVPWSKPADLPYAPTQPLPRLGGLYSDDTCIFGMWDSSPHLIHRDRVSETTLRAAITPAAGDFPGPDW